MQQRGRRIGAVAAAVVVALVVGAPVASAVDTDMAISTTAIDFGQVAAGSTAMYAVTLTNTGGDPFGPINMFGGAPPTAEFDASQNCQGNTLPAGGSCNVNYEFSPTAEGSYTDTSSFTVSETPNQGDGEDFSVTLSGISGNPTTTTTTTTTMSTTTTDTTSATTPTTNGTGSSAPTTTGEPLGDLRATVEHDEVEPGQDQEATASGFQPGEDVSAVQQPGELDLGSETADDGGEVQFTWTIAENESFGTHEFVATGADSGSVSASFTVAAVAEDDADADDDDSDTSPLLIVLLVVLALAAIGGLLYLAYRRGQRAAEQTNVEPPPPVEPTP